MTSVPTFWARIYVGLVEGYDGEIFALRDVRTVCALYCDKVGLCVTMTAAEFIYTGGDEPGAIVELINYPRFPSHPEELRHKAMTLARLLKSRMAQHRVSVMFPDETVMIGEAGAT